MRNDEFVYAVIPDHASSAEEWDKILVKQGGKTHLDRAIHKAFDTRFETGVDLVIVLSSNEAVLDAATDLGAIAHMVPGFFDTQSMIKTFVTNPGADIDPSEDPFIIVIDPYTLEIGEATPMSEIRS